MKLSSYAAVLALIEAAAPALASSLTPPLLPLTVRTPYFSTWLGHAREEPWSHWPVFYTGQEIGMSVLASVSDTNTVYPLLGRPHDSLNKYDSSYNISFAKYLGAQYDASTTNLSYLIPAPSYSQRGAKPVEVTLSFLSPVTPTSTLRQSIPASYLSVYVKGDFDISIYIDLNGLWVSGNRDSEIEWELQTHPLRDGSEGLKTWRVKKQTEDLFTEWGDRAEWGELHFTASSDVRHESGESAKLRQRFSRTGTLQNQVDHAWRRLMDAEPVFAFSKTFQLSGNDTSADSEHAGQHHTLFTLAHVQDPVVQFASARGLTMMRPLWRSWFFDTTDLIKYHYQDFKRAAKLAAEYSTKLAKDAFQSGSDNYRDIVALSARQVLGATSFSGTPESPLIFLKEISSNGNCQTVDVIFPSFPFFLYTNPRWLAYLLEPLLEHQMSGQYPNKYSMHDLGTHFPNLTGHADGNDEYMPVEECGDFLIMGLALVQSLLYGEKDVTSSPWAKLGPQDFQINDESVFPLSHISPGFEDQALDDTWGGPVKGESQAKRWLTRTYRIWKQWTSYLVEFSLEPHNQLCTDDFAGWLALQTNLALKGIVGIRAMSQMSTILGRSDDARYYHNISEVYAQKWEEFGMTRDGHHAKLAYNWHGSWTTLYSLYADSLLCFHSHANTSEDKELEAAAAAHEQQQHPLIDIDPSRKAKDLLPHHIYTRQSAFYATVIQKYGLPLDQRHLLAKSDWELEAAAVASPKTRKLILDAMALWVNETSTDKPLSDLYETEGTGGFPGPDFFARPVVGGHFAFLALENACNGQARSVLDAKGWNE